jgi:hypothetical protein
MMYLSSRAVSAPRQARSVRRAGQEAYPTRLRPGPQRHIVRTTRNWALPLIIRA